ncbi:hypothetical protein [Halopiger djelfimassiliensis]|uniref:hypothetical protein n=1 Tax=Halopiger djelfimassiliensis TaxID=1293047 RepID=UPI000677EE4E|nr:hypothetical protein [Halopiger djelfimassiliensis]
MATAGTDARGRTATKTTARWSRAFVATGVGFFLAWHLAVAAGIARPATVALGLYGFVFHVVFGKAYQLLPSYFGRQLAVPSAPAVHLPLAVIGVVGSVTDSIGVGPDVLGTVGAACWLLGCLVFVGSIGWTVRDDPTGAETGTGAVDAHRKRVDRIANAAVPFVLGYLLVGSALPLLAALELGPPNGPGATHVFAAGTAALLVFAVGFRLIPRLLVVSVRPSLVAVVVVAGVVAPAVLAADFRGGSAFRAGAVLLSLALVGFAVATGDGYRRSERRRAGGRAIPAAGLCAIAVGLLGLAFAFAGARVPSAAVEAHYRLAVGGFLGLTIVGVSYHFYPPGVVTHPGVGDRTATASVASLVVGLALETAGLLGAVPVAAAVGRGLSVLGAALYALVLGAVFLERPV